MKQEWKVKYYTCRADLDDVKHENTRKLKRGESRRNLQAGDTLWRLPVAIGEIATDHDHWAGHHLSCDEDTAERVALLWNALAGIPDPAALVASHRQLVEAGEDALTGNLMALDRLKAALATARAAMGVG